MVIMKKVPGFSYEQDLGNCRGTEAWMKKRWLSMCIVFVAIITLPRMISLFLSLSLSLVLSFSLFLSMSCPLAI